MFKELKNICICSQSKYERETGLKLEDSCNKEESKLDISVFIDGSTINTVSKSKNRGTGIISKSYVNTSNTFLNKTQENVRKKDLEEEKRIASIDIDFPYKRAELLTDAEKQLYHFMINNLCQIDKIVIFPKVRLADIIEVDSKVTRDNKYLWKITNKHVDYLICTANTLEPICVVELDDYTHESTEAKAKDIFIMQALKTAGIETFRVRTKISVISRNDLILIDDCINTFLAPNCPYCGNKMLPKSSRTGHRFYACVDFINCRNTIDIDPRGEKLP